MVGQKSLDLGQPCTTPFQKIDRDRLSFSFGLYISPFSESFPVCTGFILVVIVSSLCSFVYNLSVL